MKKMENKMELKIIIAIVISLLAIYIIFEYNIKS